MKTVPRLAVPFRVVGDRCATVEQDGEDDVAACVYAVLATELGSRIEVPRFGVRSPVFRQGGMDLDEASAAVDRWEPRADVTSEQQVLDQVARVRVEVGGQRR